MRYVIYGAGAVGATIGAKLHMSGYPVTLIARGEHLAQLQDRGLGFHDPTVSVRLELPVVASPTELDLTDEDVVILAMKGQDTAASVGELAAAAPVNVRVVCAQNGVENEQMALRRFPHVYAMYVVVPADHLQPGDVRTFGVPRSGILDLGRYPAGVDDVARAVSRDLNDAGFRSRTDETVLRAKYRKLLLNLGNAVEALLGRGADDGGLKERAREEGHAVLAAAEIEVMSVEEDRERRSGLSTTVVDGGIGRRAGSSWQSLKRGSGAIETDYLNGEIVLLGRLHGVPTPVNALLQREANRMARTGGAPGTMSLRELFGRLEPA